MYSGFDQVETFQPVSKAQHTEHNTITGAIAVQVLNGTLTFQQALNQYQARNTDWHIEILQTINRPATNK